MSNALPESVQAAKKTGIAILELTGEDDQTYYFKKPGREDISRFITTATKGKAVQAVKNLVIDMAISPTGEELTAQFVENPGKMVALNSAIQGAVGMNEDFTTKKL